MAIATGAATRPTRHAGRRRGAPAFAAVAAAVAAWAAGAGCSPLWVAAQRQPRQTDLAHDSRLAEAAERPGAHPRQKPEGSVHRRAPLALACSLLALVGATGAARGADSVLAVAAEGYGKGTMSKDEVEAAAASLSNLEKGVLFQAGTERPFTGKTVNGYAHDNKETGTYVSAISGKPLFSSTTKYESGTGWPSFWAPVSSDNIVERIDPADKKRLPERFWRVEILDKASMTHLGHAFMDGPQPTRKRYCMNAAALKFVPGDAVAPDPSQAAVEALP